MIIGLSVITSNIAFKTNDVSAFGGMCDYNYYSLNNVKFYDPCAVTCLTEGSAVAKLQGETNRDKIWNYLTQRGLSQEQAAGVMGNLQSESAGSWSPTVNEYSEEFGEGGYGIAQWTGGRRDNLIDYLTTKHPALMNNYYNENYSFSSSATDESQGFVPKNSETGELMLDDDNDTLLLAELDFLYDESTSRNLHVPAVERGYGNSTDIEWDVLRKQTSAGAASNVWVYSFEIPDNIDATASTRTLNATSILANYKNEESCPSTSKQALAKQILDSGNLTYDFGIPDIEKTIIPGIADGSNNGNDWPCGLNISILKMLADITKNHQIRANSLNRGCSEDVPDGSSTSSRHYAGNGSAIDFGPIDGSSSYNQAGADLIIEIISPYLVPNSTVGQGQSGCMPNLNVPAGVRRITDWCNHLHVDLPPNTDPDLKCKVPISWGGCDESQRV